MEIEVEKAPVEFDLYGVSGDVPNFDFAGTGRRLMDEMWKRIGERGIEQTGVNCWVYDSVNRMFAGVEIEGDDAESLEHKPVTLQKYAYYKHVGPYEKLGDVHRGMEAELTARGLKEVGPRVEKYGDWTEDQNKLVTEVFFAIE
jgi:hypothetical protein